MSSIYERHLCLWIYLAYGQIAVMFHEFPYDPCEAPQGFQSGQHRFTDPGSSVLRVAADGGQNLTLCQSFSLKRVLLQKFFFASLAVLNMCWL